MALWIGMDEAGLGPNLGPLVLTATVWRVPDSFTPDDLWDALSPVLTREWKPRDPRFHWGDSKEVYSPKQGLKQLERSVLAAFQLLGHPPRTLRELALLVDAAGTFATNGCREPWYTALDLPVPHHRPECDGPCLRDAFSAAGVELVAVRSRIIDTPTFNGLIGRYDNKSLAVSTAAFGLMADVWQPDRIEGPVRIVSDQHGGRQRYGPLLGEHFPDALFLAVEEGPKQSVYRSGTTEIRFQPRAEAHLPVALASMVCKYLRELSMHLFNDWCRRRQPDLKPTAGYPTDAKRFLAEARPIFEAAGLTEEVYWRCR